ncbi:uncharacterized protein LOC143451379 [Clavelina lepadiformis]|uniref:uncharacterized protein LOC143451379 n=1 Tax=Clavelina lepadiformis TaxID=159417 RepID=UPI0040429424
MKVVMNYNTSRDFETTTEAPSKDLLYPLQATKVTELQPTDNSVWETLIDPKKLFPTLPPLLAVITYICIVLAVATFILLTIWIITVLCDKRQRRPKKSQQRYDHNILVERNSSCSCRYNSTGCLSSVATSSFDVNSELRLFRKPKYANVIRKCNCSSSNERTTLSMRSFGKQCNRKLSPIRMRGHPSRSNRKSVAKPVLYLDRSNSCRYHRSTASCGNYVHEESSSPLQNYVDSHSLDRLVLRPYLLPRAKWDESRMIEYIRDSNKLEGGRSTGQSKEFINNEHLNADLSKASSQQSVVSTALSNKNVLTNTDPDFPDPPRLN